MTYMDDRSRWINAKLDTKFFSTFESFDERFFIDNTRDSLSEKIV